jgi:hypothetical protein
MKKDHRGFNLASKPSGDRWVEAWRHRKVGGFISVAVWSVGTSDAVTVLGVSMHQSILPRQARGLLKRVNE